MPKGSNVLVGRVVEIDRGTPVGGAIVTLVGHFDASGKPGPPNMAARDVPPTLIVMTSTDGYFVFRNLPAGRFTAMTRALGYVNHDTAIIDVADGRKTREIQLRLWKFGAIGGRVADERGDPIAGILVDALRRLPGGGVLRRVAQDVTDDRGLYRLAQLPPGDYVAAVFSTTTTLPAGVAAALDPSAANRDTFMEMRRQIGLFRTYGCPTCISNSHEGYHGGGFVLQRAGIQLPPAPTGRLLGFANTYYPGTTRAGDATLVSIGSGEARTNLDFHIKLSPAMSVSGTLLTSAGPLVHALLTLAPPGTDLNDFEPGGIASAVTDGRGRFMFLAVAPGDYVLNAIRLQNANETTGEGNPLWAEQAISVGDSDITGLTVTMRPGVRISGRAEYITTSGPVAPPSARKVITLQPMRAQGWRTIQAVIGPDGAFRSAGDPPGRYLVNASSPPGWFWHSTTLNGKPLTDETIELGSSELTGLVLTFGQSTNRLTGNVTDASGAVDSEAIVIVFPADSNSWREGLSQFASRRMRRVYASSEGAFELATFAPGDYYVAAVNARLASNWQDPRLLERLVPGSTKVTIGPEDSRTLQLRALQLTGR
jgi:hypothetical protein